MYMKLEYSDVVIDDQIQWNYEPYEIINSNPEMRLQEIQYFFSSHKNYFIILVISINNVTTRDLIYSPWYGEMDGWIEKMKNRLKS